jgi:gas vesicle protein
MGKRMIMDKSSRANFVAGLGIGLGTGVFIGTLLAPKSGRETRQVIRNSAAEGEEYLEQRGAELRDTLKGLIKAVSRQRDNLTAAIEAGTQAYRKATGKAPAVELPPTPAAAPEPEG